MIEMTECYVYVSSAPNNLSSAYGTKNAGKIYEIPCYPDEVSDSLSVNWADTSIINRTPILAYNGTGLRNISFSMDLHEDMYHGFNNNYSTPGQVGYGTYGTEQNILNLLYALRAACYPLYSTKGTLPPMVLFKFGALTMRGVLRSVNFNWKKPIIDKRYVYCTVGINMDEIQLPSRSEGNTIGSVHNPNMLTKNSKAEWIEV